MARGAVPKHVETTIHSLQRDQQFWEHPEDVGNAKMAFIIDSVENEFFVTAKLVVKPRRLRTFYVNATVYVAPQGDPGC